LAEGRLEYADSTSIDANDGDSANGSSEDMDIEVETDSLSEVEIEDLTIEVDSAMLAQQMAEVEAEMQNLEDLKAAEKEKGEKGIIVRKIQIPNCRYKNEVHYKRDKFLFIYEYDFFLYYFHQRYFHLRKFYDIVDSTRIVAKNVMDLVGNTKYRRVDFNEVVDSVGAVLPDYPVEEYLDSVITDLNLEYLATGEIKIKYRKRKQKFIYAKYKPSNMEKASLGDIKFYTMNRRKVIEELDASAYDSLLEQPDSTTEDMLMLADSLDKLKLRLFGDTAAVSADSFDVMLQMIDDQQDDASRDSLIDALSKRREVREQKQDEPDMSSENSNSEADKPASVGEMKPQEDENQTPPPPFDESGASLPPPIESGESSSKKDESE